MTGRNLGSVKAKRGRLLSTSTHHRRAGVDTWTDGTEGTWGRDAGGARANSCTRWDPVKGMLLAALNSIPVAESFCVVWLEVGWAGHVCFDWTPCTSETPLSPDCIPC
eukprot:scaffold48_cov395-Prasinococcus_capsulatus_cf.AAC.46